jgi:hypothetical protein
MPIPNEHAYLALLHLCSDNTKWAVASRVGDRFPDGLAAVVPGIYRYSVRQAAWRLASRPNRNGYLRVPFRFNGRRYEAMEHIFLFIWSYGVWPTRGRQVNHRDLNRRHNDADNLELMTQSQNLKHAARLRRAGIKGGTR